MGASSAMSVGVSVSSDHSVAPLCSGLPLGLASWRLCGVALQGSATAEPAAWLPNACGFRPVKLLWALLCLVLRGGFPQGSVPWAEWQGPGRGCVEPEREPRPQQLRAPAARC